MFGAHITILILTIAVIVYADFRSARYILGFKDALSFAESTWLHRIVWIGLLGMIVSGSLMIWPSFGSYFSYPPFLAKMGFVLVLLVNGVFIGKLMPLAAKKAFADLDKKEQHTLLLSGSLSTLGWLGALITALFFL